MMPPYCIRLKKILQTAGMLVYLFIPLLMDGCHTRNNQAPPREPAASRLEAKRLENAPPAGILSNKENKKSSGQPADSEALRHPAASEAHPASPQDTLDILFEEPGLPQPEENLATEPEPGLPSSTANIPLPQVAIIIDDMGYHRQIGKQLLALDLNLTFAFLPHSPFLQEQNALAHRLGRDILVHLPLEPRNPATDPGPGALYLRDSAAIHARQLRQDLDNVPHAIGVNNHMGSRYTENRQAMHQVLAELKRRGLFFIDSYTSSRTVGYDEAARMHIPAAKRDVFLDNIRTKEKVCEQLEKLIRVARRRGSAIGIGHPNQATLLALTRCRQLLQGRVELVPVHLLLHRAGVSSITIHRKETRQARVPANHLEL